MSAIAGIFRLDHQPVDLEELQRLGDSLAHRGPNGSGSWRDGSVGLAHQLLWTTESAQLEHMPRSSADNALVITANARLDDRDSLLRELQWTGSPHVADSELILAAYQKWGEECPRKLIGDFAFAIWDTRAQKLFCARDPFGVKPFYYFFRSGELLAFGSEIKALFAIADVPRRVNELRVAYHLVTRIDEAEMTYYQDVFRLPAAHSLVIQHGQMRIQRYYSLDPQREIRLKSDDEYAEAFRDVFMQAITAHLRGVRPVGSFLSGGLDSSSISAAAHKILNGRARLHTYSAIFPDVPEKELPKIDERQYVQAVLNSGSFVPHFIEADKLDPLMDIKQALWHEDEAFFAPNLYIHWAIYKQAQQDGAGALVDGVDGDTVVSHGWQYLPELLRSGRVRTLIREVTAYKNNTGLPLSRRAVLIDHALEPLIPAGMRAVRDHRVRKHAPKPWAHLPVNSDFMERMDMEVRLYDTEKPTPFLSARHVHRDGLTSPVYPYLFEITDKAAAAFHLEVRYPFFDRRVVEFCLALPPDQQRSQGWDRVIMRRAMQGILPPPVQWRPNKSNLSVSFRQSFTRDPQGILRRIVADFEVVSPYVDIQAAKATFQR